MMKIDIHRHLSRLSMLLWLPLLTACADDVFSGEERTDGELPVTFEFALPTTRAAEDDHHLIEDRMSFKDKDIIHIEGQFTIPGQDKKEIRYGAMTYDATKTQWTAAAGSGLTWPDEATDGTFKAYYLNPNGKDVNNENVKGGVIKKGGTTSKYSMSTLTYDTDPLQAEGKAGSYGHAVKLEFSHICTYLVVTKLGAPVSDQYWFTRREGYELKNSFFLQRNDDNTLTFNFTAHEDSRYDGLVYISTRPSDGTASFFLEPGNYDSFLLCYPAVETGYYEYIEYTYVPSESGPEKGPDLEANHSYRLDISKSKGITVSSPPQGPEEETWDESEECIEVNVEQFLRAVAAGSSYSKDGILILQGGDNSTKLLHNISFQQAYYTLFNDADAVFEPIVKQGNVFDGGHHYISDIACPVFHRNQGTIRNLGLRNIQAKFISEETELNTNDKEVYDWSRNGILCGWNKGGTVENIRIAEAAITAYVKNDTETEKDEDVSQEAHNIGCVIGSNTGTVTDVALAGNFELTVGAYTEEDYSETVDASVMIGGIVGQNAENGTITNISSYNDEKFGPLVELKITNNCSGEAGAFYVGGIAGSSSAFISWVTLPKITVNGSESSCVAMYMGGIAGQLAGTGSGSTVATSSCNITGTVKAGTVKATSKADVTPKSYIGGVAGVLEQPITDCRAAVSVLVNTAANSGVTYATGGAFGRILKTSTDISIENIMAYGDDLEGPTNFIGNFVGIAPVGETWDSYKAHDIVVRNLVSDNIGTNMN